MKNQKGFTLVELLAVIVILAIIVTIAVPSTMSISNRIKKNMFCSKIDFIENAAKLYGEDRKDSFTDKISINGEQYYGKSNVSVLELVNRKYLKKDHESEPYIEDPSGKYEKGLDELKFNIYIKNERVQVQFDENVGTTCGK